ncbi:MAG: hypothetical protein R3199_03550 [Gemmatimonadota bacterium]|nr:hypothetical protein [Gemmatimonadota bacterium]
MFLSAILALLLACGGGDDAEVSAGSDTVGQEPAVGPSPPVDTAPGSVGETAAPETAREGETDGVFRGSLTYGFDLQELVPCGDDRRLWVVDPTGELWRRHGTLAEPGEAIYVELRGRTKAPEGEQAEWYDRTLTVEEIVRVEAEPPDGC